MNFDNLIKTIEQEGYKCVYKLYEGDRFKSMMKLSFYDTLNPHIALNIASDDMRIYRGALYTNFKYQDFSISFHGFINFNIETDIKNLIKSARIQLQDSMRYYKYE